jgi:hypothetical protein
MAGGITIGRRPNCSPDERPAYARSASYGGLSHPEARSAEAEAISGISFAIFAAFVLNRNTHCNASRYGCICLKHDQNVSSNYAGQLGGALQVLDRHELRVGADARTRARANRRKMYISQMLAAANVRWQTRHSIGILVRDVMQAARLSPFFAVRALVGFLAPRASQALWRPIVRWIESIRGRPI